MSQNTPNAPTRREQLSAYPETVCVGQYPGKSWQLELDADDLDPDRLVEGPVLYVRCDIAHRSQKETAERGAVHQWRLTADDEWVNAVDLVELEQVRNGYPNSETRTLYTRPANVAALEAEIAKLRAENSYQRTQILELRNNDRRIRPAAERVCSARELISIFEARIALRAALTREGGV